MSATTTGHAKQANACAEVDGKGKIAPFVLAQTIAPNMANASTSNAIATWASLDSIVQPWSAPQIAQPTVPATTALATVLPVGVAWIVPPKRVPTNAHIMEVASTARAHAPQALPEWTAPRRCARVS